MVTAKITSNVTNTYRCLIYLVEDGIKYTQMNGGNDYTHNNVVRAVVSTGINTGIVSTLNIINTITNIESIFGVYMGFSQICY